MEATLVKYRNAFESRDGKKNCREVTDTIIYTFISSVWPLDEFSNYITDESFQTVCLFFLMYFR